MDQTLLKICTAGLLHDVGKFMDENVLGIGEQYFHQHADLYQPFDKKTGRHTHHHTILTAAFLEKMKDWLPAPFLARDWGEGEPLINLAAGHHRPEDNPWRLLIAEADRLSAGWERRSAVETETVSPAAYREIRLAPLLARLSPKDHELGTRRTRDLGFPLAALSPETIFPRPLAELRPRERSESVKRYEEHCRSFLNEVKRLAHRQENLQLWLEHFDNLLLIYAAAVPALRAGAVEESRDVSLYDHMRATAALATALYLYHKEQDSFTPKAIQDQQARKFLFINGDFYGIQEFIFSRGGESRRYQAKLLRGRSFAVTLLTELTADLLCRRLGLPFLSVVLNAAGKFTILGAYTDSALKTMKEAEEEVNDWLFQHFYGESTLGLAFCHASSDDLLSGRFVSLWERIGRRLEQRKFCRLPLERYAGPLGRYLESFRSDLPRVLCPLCGKRPAALSGREDEYTRQVEATCLICRDHIFLGANLVRRERLAVLRREALENPQEGLREPLFGKYQVIFPSGHLDKLAREGNLLRLWQVSLPEPGRFSGEIAQRFLNSYVPLATQEDRYDDRLQRLEEDDQPEPGDPRTFGQLAALALNLTAERERFQGLEALGVLKADVDDLGLLMTCGLPASKLTLSRLATLSRQLHFFFCLYLPHYLRTDDRFKNIYTVFAGGDDLFLLGAWNQIMAFAKEIPAKFRDYVGENPEVHLSAGISLQKPHSPMDQLARAAEEALQQAKGGDKNSLAIFGEVASWEKVGELQVVLDKLRDWLDKGWVNNAMLYRLNEFIRMVVEERRLIATNQVIHLDDLSCLNWRSHLAYASERNVAQTLKGEARTQAACQVQEQLSYWLEAHAGCLKMPLWTLLYEKRLRR